jgi:O-antigen/teichoic acid export membrane protein
LTRLYTPSEFGVFNAALGISMLLATLCSLSYPAAIPLTSADDDAGDLLWVANVGGLVLIVPLTTFISILLTNHSTDFSSRVLWVVIGATASSIVFWTSARAFATRFANFNRMSGWGVVDSTFQAGGQVSLGQSSIGPVGLGFGYLLGKVIAATGLLWSTRRHIGRPRDPRRVAREWAKQGFLLTPASLLNQSVIAAVGPLVVLLFGSRSAGLFALAARMLAVPSALVGQSVADVFYSRVARMNRQGASTSQAVELVASSLMIIALPIFAIPLLLGPELFAFAFGSEWRDAGTVAMVLSPWLALNLVSSPISGVITVKRRNGMLLFVALIEASCRTAALIIGDRLGSWGTALVGYSATGALISLLAIAWSLRLSHVSFLSWARQIGRQSLPSFCLLLTALVSKHFVSLPIYLALVVVIMIYIVRRSVFILGLFLKKSTLN